MAAAWRLPVIFVCENNGIACSVDFATSGQQSVENLADRAAGYHMPSEIVDGNDFFAVYEAAQKLVKRAREGEGNCCGFLECKTFRVGPHIIGDQQPYRDPVKAWNHLHEDDCIARFRERCVAEGWLDESDFAPIDERVDGMIAEAVRFARESPYPDASKLYEDIYD